MFISFPDRELCPISIKTTCISDFRNAVTQSSLGVSMTDVNMRFVISLSYNHWHVRWMYTVDSIKQLHVLPRHQSSILGIICSCLSQPVLATSQITAWRHLIQLYKLLKYCTISITSSRGRTRDKLDEGKLPSISDGTRDICPNPAIVKAGQFQVDHQP